MLESKKFLRTPFFTEHLQWLILKRIRKHSGCVQNLRPVSGSITVCSCVSIRVSRSLFVAASLHGFKKFTFYGHEVSQICKTLLLRKILY